MSTTNSLSAEGIENVKNNKNYGSADKLQVSPPDISFIKKKLENEAERGKILDLPCVEECYDIYVEFERRLKECSKSLSNRDILIGVLQGQLKKMEDLYKKTIDELQLMRYKYCSTVQELNSIKKICDHLESDNLRLSKAQENCQTEKLNNMLREELNKVTCKCKEDIKNDSEEVNQLKLKIKKLEEENNNLAKENRHLKVFDSDSDSENSNSRYNTRTPVFEFSPPDQLNNELIYKDDIIKKLEDDVTKLNLVINDLKMKNNQCDNACELKVNELKQCRKELTETKIDISALKQENQELKNKIQEYKQEICSLQSNIEEINTLKSILESLELNCSQLENELQKQTDVVHEKSKYYEEIIEQIRVKQNFSSGDIDNVSNNIKKNSLIIDLQQKSFILEEKICECNLIIKNKEHQIESLVKGMETLHTENLNLETETKCLQADNEWLQEQYSDSLKNYSHHSSMLTAAGSIDADYFKEMTKTNFENINKGSETALKLDDIPDFLDKEDNKTTSFSYKNINQSDSNNTLIKKIMSLQNLYEALQIEHNQQEVIIEALKENIQKGKEFEKMYLENFEIAQNELNALKTTLVELQNDRQTNYNTIKDLQLKLQNVSSKLELHAHTSVSKLNEKIQNLKIKCRCSEMENNSTSKELNDMNNNLNVLNNKLSNKENEIKELAAELEFTKFNLVELQKLYENLQERTCTTMQNCTSKMNESDKLLVISQHDNNSLRKEISNYEVITEEYEVKIQKLQDSHKKVIVKLIGENEQLFENYNEKIKDFENTTKKLKQHIEDLQKENSELLKKYQTDLEHFTNQRTELTELNEENRQMCKDLCSKYNNKLNELQECNQNLERLNNKVDSLEQENSDLKLNVQLLQKQLDSRLEENLSNNNSLNDKINLLEQENSELKLKIQNLKKETDSRLEENLEYEENVCKLTQDIERETSCNKCLRQEIINLKVQIVEIQNTPKCDCEERTKLLEKYRVDLDKKSDIIRQLEEDKNELKYKYESLENENNSIKKKYEDEINENVENYSNKNDLLKNLEDENSRLKNEITILQEKVLLMEKNELTNNSGDSIKSSHIQIEESVIVKYKTDISNLQKLIFNLQRDIEILSENYKNRIKSLQEDIKDIEEDYEGRIEKLLEQNKKFLDELEQKYLQEIKQKQSIIDSCQCVIDKNNTMMAKLRQENSNLQDDLQDYRNEVIRLQKKDNEDDVYAEDPRSVILQEEIDCLTRDRDNYMKALMESQYKIEYLSNELNDKKREIENCECTMEEYDAKMEDMDKRINEIGNSHAELKCENEVLVKENKYLYDQLLELSGEKKDSISSYSSMSSCCLCRIESVNKIEKFQVENGPLKELGDISEQNSENIEKIAKISGEIEKLSETFIVQLTTCSGQSNTSEGNGSTTKSKKQENELTRNQLENEINKLKSKVKEQAEEIQYLQQNQVIDTTDNMAKLKLEFEDIEQKYEQHLKEWQNEITKYQVELEKTYSENENLQRQSKVFQSQIEVLTTTLEQYKQDSQFVNQEKLDLRKKESQLLKDMCACKNVTQSIKSYDHDYEELQELYNNIYEEMVDKNNQISRLQNKLITLENAMPGCNLVEELINIKHSYSRLKKEYDDLKILYDDHLDMYRGEVLQLKVEENNNILEQVSSKEIRDAKDKKIARLELDVKEEEIKVKILEDDLQNKIHEINELKDICSKLTVTNNNLKLEIIDLENQIEGFFGGTSNFTPKEAKPEVGKTVVKPTCSLSCEERTSVQNQKQPNVLFRNSKYDEEKYSSEGTRKKSSGYCNINSTLLKDTAKESNEVTRDSVGSSNRCTKSGNTNCSFNIMSDFVITQQMLQEKIADEIKLKKECQCLKQQLNEKNKIIEKNVEDTKKEVKRLAENLVKKETSKPIYGPSYRPTYVNQRPPTRRDNQCSPRGSGRGIPSTSRLDKSPTKEECMALLSKKITESCPASKDDVSCSCVPKVDENLKSKYLI